MLGREAGAQSRRALNRWLTNHGFETLSGATYQRLLAEAVATQSPTALLPDATLTEAIRRLITFIDAGPIPPPPQALAALALEYAFSAEGVADRLAGVLFARVLLTADGERLSECASEPPSPYAAGRGPPR